MKNCILIFVCSLTCSIAYAQNSKIAIDSLLRQEQIIWEQLNKNELTTKQWYAKKIELGHYDNGIQAWFKYDEPVNVLSKQYQQLLDSSGILLFIPEDYQVERMNGNKYIKMYLLNLTDSTLTIPRMDATIDNFSTEILINSTWVEFQTTKGASCGNSYWNGKLNSKYIMELEVSNSALLSGDKKNKIRIVYNHFGSRVVSNPVAVMLNSNQIARIKYNVE